jgi:predicted ATP-dependent endonuclease of OLD family
MNYIKSLHVEGYKKFKLLDMDFNEHMNIIVGENEAGKSTVLDALKTVLTQQYRNADKAILHDLFNIEMVKEFENNPSFNTLPYIVIETEFILDSKDSNSDYFYGEVYGDRKSQEEHFGIRFECRFDRELGSGLEKSIGEGKIPYEYYTLTWTTFANRPYVMLKKPLSFVFVDTSNNGSNYSYNNYNRTVFSKIYDDETKARVKNKFRENLNSTFDNVELENIDDHRKFGIDEKKVILESIISIYEDSIALENKGSGMESIIKTKIALSSKSKFDVITIEEPENHLCFSNMNKMLQEITSKQEGAQIIVTTHSSMITSRLNLNNVIWLAENHAQNLRNVKRETAKFFEKIDDNSILQLLLSKKVILVEGATEYLLVPMFFEQEEITSLADNEITIISCNGVSYKHYLEIAKETDKRIAVITDNDKKQKKIDEADRFNKDNDKQHIFMDKDIENWTWEKCVYLKNQETLDSLIKTEENAQYLFHGEDYGPKVGKMLNSKVETAYGMLTCGVKFEMPEYVKEAIEWINE